MKKMFLPVVLSLVFVLAACGGGGSGASTTIDVTFEEFTFTPTDFTIPAGREITVNATNKGAVLHEFVIMKLGETVGDDFGDEDEGNIYWEVEADAGASVTQTFTAPSEPGEYQVVCGTEGHFVAGMVGKLTVVAP
ncbi:MAG: cupredoxin domain-containing protein [Anaerolineales bacterium]|nr:cupredoxin domain-containing protein [Anaerolineales bacterium]